MFYCLYLWHHLIDTSFMVYLMTASSRIPSNGEVMVKVTLEQATKAHRGSRGIAVHFL